MKRKTYMIFLIMSLVCLTACNVQAMTYKDCRVIAVGKSTITVPDGAKTPYKGYLPYANFYNSSMLILVILPPVHRGPDPCRYNLILMHPTTISFENATGTFVWNLQHGTYINAHIATVVIEWRAKLNSG